jgi:capsular exopolysaccharide synthesis family protein
MSLIESAVQKAKQLAGDAPKQPSPAHVRPVHLRPPERDAATLAAEAARARVLPKASVDQQAMEKAGVMLAVEDEAAHSAYRILRTRVQQRMQAQGWHSIGVTAAGVGEGKTLTSLNLALALARDPNTWVFVVDLDLTRPKVASYLGLKFDKGLSDYLAGNARFEDIVYDPGVERLAVIPNAQPLRYSSELIGSPRMQELCDSLAAEAPRRIVVFDLPPVLMTDDVMKFAPNLDCTLFVVSEGVTARDVLQKTKEVLDEMNLLGVVLNRSTETGKSYYY